MATLVIYCGISGNEYEHTISSEDPEQDLICPGCNDPSATLNGVPKKTRENRVSISTKAKHSISMLQ